MARVTVPPGCRGLDMQDGTPYTAQGSHVEVSDDHARAIRRQYGGSGVITGEVFGFGTKTGRWCVPCRRVWNAWSHACPRCGRDTVLDAELGRVS